MNQPIHLASDKAGVRPGVCTNESNNPPCFPLFLATAPDPAPAPTFYLHLWSGGAITCFLFRSENEIHC